MPSPRVYYFYRVDHCSAIIHACSVILDSWVVEVRLTPAYLQRTIILQGVKKILIDSLSSPFLLTEIIGCLELEPMECTNR